MLTLPAGVRRTRVWWLFGLLTGVSLLTVLALPGDAGAVAFLTFCAVGTTAVAAGRRMWATSAHPWRCLTWACGLFLTGAALRGLLPAVPLAQATSAALVPDAVTLAGYLLLVEGLLAMLRTRRSLTDAAARTDALIVVLAAALGAWMFLIDPVLSSGDQVPTYLAVLAATFPVLDVLLVGVVAQLAFSAGAARLPALWLLAGGMVSLLAGDLSYAAATAGYVEGHELLSQTGYLLAYAGVGAAALHPTMAALTSPQAQRPRPLSRARSLGIALALLAPVATAIMFPASGATDTVVRLTLSAALTAAVAIRTVRAVNDHAQAESGARHQATHDPLTGLPNRAALAEHMATSAQGPTSAVLFMDLDGFKLVNDSWGHQVGDELLQAVAARLTSVVRAGDLVCRVGGDEFVVVLGAPHGRAGATAVATGIVAAFDTAFTLSVGPVFVTPSIGIATIDAGAEDLIRDADTAMYRTKETGRNGFTFFDASLREQVQARAALEQDLRHALDRGEFEVYYQPIIDLGTDELSGFEALLRWNHPERGRVGPDEFIPVAEETGLIVPIGAWVLQQAIDQLARWQDNLGPVRNLHMSINVSARQLRHPTLVQEAAVAMAEAGVRPHSVWLEITESAMMGDPEASAATLDRLRALGVQLSVDDFGTGYSALGYLKRFPVGVVKIDRSFVSGLGEDLDSDAIVRAVVAMAHAIGLRVVAEGVETTVQRDRLRMLGCDMVQGFLYGRPRPASESLLIHDRWLAGAV